jgi:hypothetical protein
MIKIYILCAICFSLGYLTACLMIIAKGNIDER